MNGDAQAGMVLLLLHRAALAAPLGPHGHFITRAPFIIHHYIDTVWVLRFRGSGAVSGVSGLMVGGWSAWLRVQGFRAPRWLRPSGPTVTSSPPHLSSYTFVHPDNFTVPMSSLDRAR